MALEISFTEREPSGVSKPDSCGRFRWYRSSVVDDGLIADTFAVIIYENIPHNGKYPPFEIDVVDIFITVVEGFQGRVL